MYQIEAIGNLASVYHGSSDRTNWYRIYLKGRMRGQQLTKYQQLRWSTRSLKAGSYYALTEGVNPLRPHSWGNVPKGTPLFLSTFYNSAFHWNSNDLGFQKISFFVQGKGVRDARYFLLRFIAPHAQPAAAVSRSINSVIRSKFDL